MEKLAALRKLMSEQGIAAYVIPSGDAHNTEYVAPYWSARKWFSGFTGSAGLAVVTHSIAGVWADGRYFIQAEKELAGTDLTLFKMNEPDVPTYEEFLYKQLKPGDTVAFDGRSMSMEAFHDLKEILEPKNIKYAYEADLVGDIWLDRPPLPTGLAFEHPPAFARLSATEKLAQVREKMAAEGVDYYLVTSLTDIAWLLNIRGNDIPYLPVIYAYVLITEKDATIFVSPDKITDISAKLEAQGFRLDQYENIANAVKALPSEGVIHYTQKKTNMLLAEAIPQGVTHKTDMDNIISHLKGVKSDKELENIRNAYTKEGVAMVKLLAWLDQGVAAGETITEDDVAKKLTALRTTQPHAIGDSFCTISAYGPNAALPHYRHEGTGATIKPEGFFLLDTGGQYLDGTTDTTRTMAMGPLTQEMKNDYTYVLKGHLAVNNAIFPPKTTGVAIDALARQPVLQSQQNYNHGTGHGIGYCLGVHEGPHGVSSRSTLDFAPGMLISNEPGIYKAGRHGIRIENVLAVQVLCTNDFGTFHHFENLTLCPYDTQGINPDLLTPEEITCLNNYHAKVYEVLAPLLTQDEQDWLAAATAAL